MLQTLREYGLECLAHAGEMDVTHATHAAYFLSLAEEADPYLLSAEQLYWLDLLEQEHENLRAAFEEMLEPVVGARLMAPVVAMQHVADVDHVEDGRHQSGPYDDFAPAEQALRLCIALTGFWEVRGYFREGWDFLERALAVSEGVANFIRAKALFVGGFLAYVQDHRERADTLLQESLALFRESGDQVSMANVLRMQGNLAKAQSAYKQARSLLEDALAIYKRLDDKKGMASIYTVLAQVYLSQGDYTRAISLLDACLTLYKIMDENYLIAYPLYHLARTLFLAKGDPAQAHALAEESLALFKSVRDKRFTPYVLILLGQIALVQGEVARARALLEECRTTLQELGDRFGTATALMFLARTTTAQSDMTQARMLYEECWELLRKIDDKEQSASCLEGMGEVVAKQGLFKWAAQLWGTAATLRADIVAPMPPIYRAPYQQAVAFVRAQLGEAAFKAGWAEGGKVPLKHALVGK